MSHLIILPQIEDECYAAVLGMVRRPHLFSEAQKKRSLLQRIMFLHGILLIFGLLIVSRLLELQILDRGVYFAQAQDQHLDGIRLPAQRGDVLAINSKTSETTILATNTTLDLLYIDPFVTDDPSLVAEKLSDILLTTEFHTWCSQGKAECPRELILFYADAFDPLHFVRGVATGSLLEPLPSELPTRGLDLKLPDITEIRRQFARNIESRISEQKVTFVPIKYGATKVQMQKIQALNIPGIGINWDDNLVYANPEDVSQQRLSALGRSIAPILELDPAVVAHSLRTRPLRYVPVMRRLTPKLSLAVKQLKLASLKDTNTRRAQVRTRQERDKIQDPLRAIALIPEHWRYYPDGTVGSHVVGFLNTNQEAQYGIERTFDPLLRGQEGLISTVSDEQGGQILTSDQRIIDPKDGDTIVLTIDPFIQKEVERILESGLKKYEAESAQAIVMDPYTGRIIAMANVPLFERNSYGSVYEKTPIYIAPEKEQGIVVEVFHPTTNARIVKAYWKDVFTQTGRQTLSEKVRQSLDEVEQLFDLKDLARYYLYLGENARREIFPSGISGVWLKYSNNLGVGAYLNRTIQEIYEPGSVLKPITMSIAIDQGEVVPTDTYDDKEDVRVDEFTIKNALLTHYGVSTMTNCLEFSINTCMTSVSSKLGKKLFHRMLERFGFGRITGIELDDELPGAILPWRNWSNALLATASFGQGISTTPLQMITAYTALANGGKLMRPTIIDRIIHADGTVDQFEPKIFDQVITPQTSETITAMLVSSVDNGYAKTAKVKHYKIAGKTGTSQIAGPGGKYEAGTGSTVASFIGYAPVDHPAFLVLVKFDRPKFKNEAHGSATAAPTFREIATFLFHYYGFPPDE